MGLITSTLRLAYLNNYRLDLEYKMQLISDAKLTLANSVNELMGASSNLEPDSPESKVLEQRKERLYIIEKQLDQQMQRFQAQLKMAEAEMQQCQQSMDKNLQIFYGGGR